jgi:GNAT superfamily N-acetyltransferase
MNQAGQGKLIIRRARPEDQSATLRLIARHRTADAKQARKTYREQLQTGKRLRDRVFAAEQDGRIVGVSGFWYDDDSGYGVYSLNWTYVDQRLQRQGIGSKLMAKVDNELRKRHARKLYVQTSNRKLYQDALQFYLRNGFKREAVLRDYYDRGEDQIILGKEL